MFMVLFPQLPSVKRWSWPPLLEGGEIRSVALENCWELVTKKRCPKSLGIKWALTRIHGHDKLVAYVQHNVNEGPIIWVVPAFR
jgi:hypothetical protein